MKIVIFIVLIIGVFAVFKFRQMTYNSLWNSNDRLSIVLSLKKNNNNTTNPFLKKYPSVWVVSFEPQEKKLTVLLVPDNTWVDVTHGYGSYRADAVYPLGEIEGNAGPLLKSSFAYFLGLPIDGWADGLDKVAGRNDFIGELTVQNTQKILLAFFYDRFQGKVDANISGWDALQLFWAIRSVPENKVKVIDLAGSNVTLEDKLADGSAILRLDPIRFDRLVSSEFTNDSIRQENFDAAVFNTTAVTGVAAKAARMMTNIGIHIVKIGQIDSKELVESKRCKIISEKDGLNSDTVKQMNLAFNCDLVEANTDLYRAKVVLILGEGFEKEINSH